MTLAATPPLFDGPEDRNGRRNRDEVLFWAHYLNGRLGPVPEGPLAVVGNFNLDPDRGDGLRAAAAEVLAHPRLQDPLSARPTARFRSVGDMRISYVLPSVDLTVTGADVMSPEEQTGRHRLLWVNMSLDEGRSEEQAQVPAPAPQPAGSAETLAEAR